ncbi:DUF7822 domain-containing protein [Sphingomonas bacterium]|uniref:DUF7822 domain-containing protein n=1 Tax=Sphingomonas bacterium TaxID=1895847 RepID=UPI001576B203|nr:hypothetical protein [Sphingomonas bacterium]
MANRSYLYATDTVPGREPTSAMAEKVGLSEWRYVIPLAHTILVSADTAPCPSTIWDGQEAFVGNYADGLARLKGFLGQVAAPPAQPLIHNAIAFLERAANRRKYILLEVEEIFRMDDDPEGQAGIFAARLANLVDDMALEIASLPPVPAIAAPGFLTRLFGQTGLGPTAADAGVIEAVEEWGLGAWFNHLYYQ